ncbi:sigma-70 family RNA polymerase sigma factor [Oceanobacillus kapialis]|uniref:Sigma-70 family RNA polymerase sigma factor n=1 Tax=Oceanobacillus kapialis TaxID=481353 RepID=A0ABW5PW77_9BACI
MALKKLEKDDMKKLEEYLKSYNSYKTAINLIKKQLDYLVPGFVSQFELDEENKGKFTLHSLGNEVDRLSSIKALNLYEELLHYNIIVASIEEAIEDLEELERQFITSRYIKGKSIVQTSFDLGYSEKYVFIIRKQTLTKLLISLKGLLFL